MIAIYLNVLYHAVLSNDTMRPQCLERHLTTNDPSLKEKTAKFFRATKNSLKQIKLYSSGNFHVENKKAVEDFYKMTLLIAKGEQPHIIGESLIKPCFPISCSTTKSLFFSLQCGETTDISNHSQLLYYCRFIDGKLFMEEILFSQTLQTKTKAINVFSALNTFLAVNNLPWANELAKKRDPNIIGSHYIIHKQTLSCKALSESLNIFFWQSKQ
ncbi:hypothetical protein PR048_013364 [Dryococelus australis]|uniref:Uncharacterized protein n=1 Tax=Dryococelus australis TaxID=614101 RepID=A0ABQ9HRY7_9NEOP|nr:hypothetical protein PR048_013364 [Dryococelus australis]